MKHPALARVFAIVLALLSSFMLINGALGFSKADGTLQESLEYCQRIEDKLNEYEELDAKLENSISYDEAYEELERLQEEHDEEAAQHRTDLATHTATMGGYTMGVDMITDGKAQLEAAKQELESGKQQLAQQEALLNKSVEEFNNVTKPGLNAFKDAMAKYSADLQSSAAQISVLAASLDAYIASPSEPGGDEGGDQPGGEGGEEPGGEGGEEPGGEGGEEPGGDGGEVPGGDGGEVPGGEGGEVPGGDGGESGQTGGNVTQPEGEDVTDGGNESTDVSEAVGGQEQTVTTVPGEAGDIPDESNSLVASGLSFKPESMALAAKTLSSVSTGVDTEEPGGGDDGYKELIASINDQLATVETQAIAVNMILNQSPEIAGMVGLSAITLPENFTADSDPAAVKAQLQSLAAQLGTAAQINNILQGVITQTEAQFQEGQAALEKGKRQLVSGEEALKKGENELQHQLELLWYNMGQLDDEAEELEENKEKLDAEADKLDKMLVSVDELKELEDGRRSARIILMQESEIEAMVNEGGELGDSVRSFLEQHRSSAEYDNRMLYIINSLAVIGGLLGLLSIVGSYELLKQRLVLVVPPLLCLICAAAAYGINLYQGLGQMYTALFAAIGALLHLLIVIPRNKPVNITEASQLETPAPTE